MDIVIIYKTLTYFRSTLNEITIIKIYDVNGISLDWIVKKDYKYFSGCTFLMLGSFWGFGRDVSYNAMAYLLTGKYPHGNGISSV